MCKICKLEADGVYQPLETNKGIEIEICIEKFGIFNYTDFPSYMLCTNKHARIYPDATPVAEFTTPYTSNYDLLLESIKTTIRYAKEKIKFTRMTNFHKSTSASNHIHYSNGGNFDKLTEFAKELCKLQPFLFFFTAGAPDIENNWISYRHGAIFDSRYINHRLIVDLSTIDYTFARRSHEHNTIAVANYGDHIEIRIQDGMLFPVHQIATCVFYDAVYKAITENNRQFPLYNINGFDIKQNCMNILHYTNPKLLKFKKTPAGDNEIRITKETYCNYVIDFYKKEINEQINTIQSPGLKRAVTEIINLTAKGLNIPLLIAKAPDYNALEDFFYDQYCHYLYPIKYWNEFKKLVNIPRLLSTRIVTHRTSIPKPSIYMMLERKMLELITNTLNDNFDFYRAEILKTIRNTSKSESSALRRTQIFFKKFLEKYNNVPIVIRDNRGRNRLFFKIVRINKIKTEIIIGEI